jgi:hypothetical protein
VSSPRKLSLQFLPQDLFGNKIKMYDLLLIVK